MGKPIQLAQHNQKYDVEEKIMSMYMQKKSDQDSRKLLMGFSALLASSLVKAQSFEFKPKQRHTEYATFISDACFIKYCLQNSTLTPWSV